MTPSYGRELRSRLPLALCGTYAWLVSVVPILSGLRTVLLGLLGFLSLLLGFLLPRRAFLRPLAVFAFPLLSALSFFVAEEADLALEWFAILGWIAFAAASGFSELEAEVANEESSGRAPLAPRRSTSRALLLVPLWFGCAVLALWAFGKPLEGGHKGVLLLLVLLSAGLLLFRTSGNWGMSFTSPGPETSLWKGRIVPLVFLVGAALLLAMRRLVAG